MHPLRTDWNQQFMCLDYFHQPLAHCVRHESWGRRSLQRRSSLERWTDTGSYRVVLCYTETVRECARFAFSWTISFLLSCPFCTYRHTTGLKAVVWKWNRIEYSSRIHPKFISPISGDLYGKPGTNTSEICQSVIKLLPLDKHQLIFLCCPEHWPSWISPLPAASPPHSHWDRWE